MKQLYLPFLLLLCPCFLFAQMPSKPLTASEKATWDAARRYITKHRPLARKVHRHYGVPECIVLAVAGIETNWGRSELAVRANNHFGIKAKKENWVGPIYYKNTEEYSFASGWEKRMDTFRSYESVDWSYDDFGLYLRRRGLYDALFHIPVNNYREWARQLQKAGYASDQKYADKLIRVIEMYQLAPDVVKVSQRQNILLNKW